MAENAAAVVVEAIKNPENSTSALTAHDSSMAAISPLETFEMTV